MCGCLSSGPHWGPGPQPRHVPWPGMEPMTLRFTACTQSTELHQPGLDLLLSCSFLRHSGARIEYPLGTLYTSGFLSHCLGNEIYQDRGTTRLGTVMPYLPSFRNSDGLVTGAWHQLFLEGLSYQTRVGNDSRRNRTLQVHSGWGDP